MSKIEKIIFMFSFLLSGVLGLLLYFGSAQGIVFSGILIYPAAVLWCAFFAYLFFYKRKIFYYTAAAVIAACLLTSAIGHNLILTQLMYAADALTGDSVQNPPSVTFLVLTALPILTLILFMAEAVIKNHIILYIITTALMLAAPILGLKHSGAALALLALFQISFWVMRTANTPSVAEKSAIITCGIIAVIIAVAAPLTYLSMDKLSDMTYSAENLIFRAVMKYTDKNIDLIQSDTISRFNNYRTDREQMIVQITREPKEPTYLRGFVGGEYHKGKWEAADDTAVLNSIQEKYQNNWGILGITNTYSSLYFTMNTNTMDDTIPNPASMAVRYISLDGKNYYVPYYSRVETIYVFGGYRFQYYEKENMHVNWNNVAPLFAQKRDQCLNLQTAYMAEAKEAYTHVPENEVPRLAELCKEQELDSLSEITDFITTTLNERTEYTLTPGWSSLNTDVVEDFLFDRGRGYCVHYAAAATLMYRMFGVPARYVTGYMIPPEDFERQQYLTYNAVLKDKNSHAWVEIFLQDYGWTPIEVTPTIETGSEIYPGYSAPGKNEQETSLNLNINLIPKNQNLSSDTEDIEQEKAVTDEETETQITDYTIYDRAERPIRIVFGLILIGIILATAAWLISKKLRRRKNRNCRTEFARLLDVLHIGGLLMDYDGDEPEFAERLNEAVPSIGIKDLRKMLRIVSAAAYGPDEPSAADNEFAIKVCYAVAESVYKTLNFRQKIVSSIKLLIFY